LPQKLHKSCSLESVGLAIFCPPEAKFRSREPS
jgi:hypothetical protein